MWCKNEPSDGVELHDIDTGESICENCLKDVRRFKREVDFSVLLSTRIPEELRREVSKAAYEAGEEVFKGSEWELATHSVVTSNAKGRNEEDTD